MPAIRLLFNGIVLLLSPFILVAIFGMWVADKMKGCE
jgi:hypothetical protein